MIPRSNTPNERLVAEDGTVSTRIHLKRACNGCGRHVGDPDERDFDERGRLTDVRGECPNCAPVVELEAQGCEARQLTPRSLYDLWRWVGGGLDRLLAEELPTGTFGGSRTPQPAAQPTRREPDPQAAAHVRDLLAALDQPRRRHLRVVPDTDQARRAA